MTRPARSSTLMCLEIAGNVKSKGPASSLTVASPSASGPGSLAGRLAKAANVSVRRSSTWVAVAMASVLS